MSENTDTKANADVVVQDIGNGVMRATAVPNDIVEAAAAPTESTQAAPERAPAEPPKAPSTPQTNQPTEAQAREAVQSAGLNFDGLVEEFVREGRLSDKSYADLEKAGIPRAIVDSYIEGQKAQAELTKQRVFSAIGGESEFQRLASWMRENLSEAELASYNRIADTGTEADLVFVLQGMKARMEQALGRPPARSLSAEAVVSDSDAFENVEQMLAAIRDPRYQKDSAYRARVMAKAQRSNF